MVLEKRKLIVKDLYEESLFLLFIREILISNKDLKTWNKILSYNTINRFSDEEIKFFLKKLKEKGYIKSKNDFNYTYVPDDDFYFLLKISESLLEDYKNNKQNLIVRISDSEMEINPGISLRSDYDIRWTLKWSLLWEIEQLDEVFSYITNLKDNDWIINIDFTSEEINDLILEQTEFIAKLLELESNWKIKILNYDYLRKTNFLKFKIKIINIEKKFYNIDYNEVTQVITIDWNTFDLTLYKTSTEIMWKKKPLLILLVFYSKKRESLKLEDLKEWFTNMLKKKKSYTKKKNENLKEEHKKVKKVTATRTLSDKELIGYISRSKKFLLELWFQITFNEETYLCSLKYIWKKV